MSVYDYYIVDFSKKNRNGVGKDNFKMLCILVKNKTHRMKI